MNEDNVNQNAKEHGLSLKRWGNKTEFFNACGDKIGQVVIEVCHLGTLWMVDETQTAYYDRSVAENVFIDAVHMA